MRGSRITGPVVCAALSFFISQPARPDIGNVLSNKMGATAKYPQEALEWFNKNQPTLPAKYWNEPGFFAIDPIVDYLDAVNWSLIPLRQFKEIHKARWARVPQNTKIKRDASGGWRWPVGSEVLKLITAAAKTGSTTSQQDLELRIERKLSDDESGGVWAMATYTRSNSQEWRVALPNRLGFDVPNAVTPLGVRTVTHLLTPPEGCMTCHSLAGKSSMDYKRGGNFVYASLDDLLTGRVRIRLSQYEGYPGQHHLVKELSRSKADDWIDLELIDKSIITKNRSILAPIIDGPLPPM